MRVDCERESHLPRVYVCACACMCVPGVFIFLLRENRTNILNLHKSILMH